MLRLDTLKRGFNQGAIKLTHFLKQKWVLLFSLLLLLLILIWFVGPGVSIFSHQPLASFWHRLWACVGLLLLFGVFFGLNYWKKRGNLKAAIAKWLAFIKLKRRLRQCFQSLADCLEKKKWRMDAGKVYQLPWYLVIGPAGSGKKTFLAHSGLRFSRTSLDDLITGEEPLPIEWRVSMEGVFITCSAQLLTSGDVIAKKLRRYLLKQIQRLRPRQPLNGILLTWNLKGLIDERHSVVPMDETLRQIRHFLWDIQKAFHMRLPIYVIATHVDTLAGFEHYVSELSADMQSKPCGFCLPYQGSSSLDKRMEDWDAVYAHFLQRVSLISLKNLTKLFGVEEAQANYAFSFQLDRLKPLLTQVVLGLIGHQQFFDDFCLRGLYFVSLAQTKQSIDLLADTGYVTVPVNPVTLATKAYFSQQIFANFVLGEAQLAGFNPKAEYRYRWLRVGQMAGIIAGALLFSGLWVTSYARHLDFDLKASVSVEQYQHALIRGQDSWQAQATLLAQVSSLVNAYQKQESAWLYQVGLYHQNQAFSALLQLYHALLENAFLPGLQHTIATQLQQATKAVAKQTDKKQKMQAHQALYQWLSCYLMLSQKQNRQAKWLALVLTHYWQTEDLGQKQRQVQKVRYLTDLLTFDFKGLPLQESLVQKARELLWHTPLDLQAYFHLVMRMVPQGNFALVSRLSIYDQQVFQMASQINLPVLYTKAGFQTLYLPNAKNELQVAATHQWVLGTEYPVNYSHADLVQAYTQMTLLYWQDYFNDWRHAIANIHIKPVTDIDSMIEQLQILSADQSPLLHVLQLIVDNTHALPMADSQSDDSPDSALAENMVNQHFAALADLLQQQSGEKKPAIQNILASLNGLNDYLATITNSSNPDHAAYNAAVAIMQGSPNQAIAAIKAMANHAPEPVKRWLNEVLANTYRAIFAQAARYLSDLWNVKVYAFYHTALKGRFPFDSQAKDFVALKDFTAFFGPKGILLTFLRGEMAPFVEIEGDGNVAWQVVDGVPFSPNRALLTQLSTAQKMTQAFFTKGNLHVDLKLTAVNLNDEITELDLSEGKAQVSTSGGALPASVPLDWPVENGELKLHLSGGWFGHDSDKTFKDDWALFRWLAAGTLLPEKSSGQYVLQYGQGKQVAQIVFSASSVVNPLSLWPKITTFHLPEHFSEDSTS